MSNLEDLARRFFQLELPTTEAALKSSFRREAFKAHPDQGGSAYQFQALRDAYEQLMSNPLILTSHEREDHTLDGTPLTKLGLGLGPNINGRNCEDCDSLGYLIHHDFEYTRCDLCQGDCYVYPCRACSTTGKFTQAARGTLPPRQVPCRVCSGKGWIPSIGWIWSKPHGSSACRQCLATGRVKLKRPQKHYIKCGTCEGTGEIKIYNPVLPKGRLR